ncbi:MAG: N-acetylmuramoyl-L-alanine amidase [Clostridiales bacterium]|nr:N-acetylmuramoyl-L-alanine amidase [Clostridiales bacterium]
MKERTGRESSGRVENGYRFYEFYGKRGHGVRALLAFAVFMVTLMSLGGCQMREYEKIDLTQAVENASVAEKLQSEAFVERVVAEKETREIRITAEPLAVVSTAAEIVKGPGESDRAGAGAETEIQVDAQSEVQTDLQSETVALDPSWKYADFAKITSGTATLYRSEAENRVGKVVCVNAGHGTSGGSSVKTQCHPDGTPKVTGGTTSAGSTTAVAVSGGMQFADGRAEAEVTLALALVLKEELLARGYDVLMIRESSDIQLDNIARTVIANNAADCHIALHWDSTSSDKGAFYMSVPDVASYRAMEPVASHWQEHHALGESLIAGLSGAGVKIFSGGSMAMDLTQTSYSTVPSVDIELGDKVSDHSTEALNVLAEGLADGVERFFGE